MVTKRWRVTISKVDEIRSAQQMDVESSNWIAALRAARHRLGEDGAVPQGANCAVDDTGAVTVIDPTSTRQFVIAALGDAAPASGSSRAASAHSKPKHLSQTMAYLPDAQSIGRPASGAVPPARPPTSAPSSAGDISAPMAPGGPVGALQPPPADPARTRRRRSATLAFEVGQHGHLIAKGEFGTPAAITTSEVAANASPQPDQAARSPRVSDVSTLLELDEEPSKDSPLTYRERAYLLPSGTALEDAERALREKLQELQDGMTRARKGKYVRLAAFDYHWSRIPSRPPLALLEWRDWRGEVTIEYPARVRTGTTTPPRDAELQERLATVRAPSDQLRKCQTLLDALKLALQLIVDAIPCEAASACLYDVSTHELRFVVVQGGNEKRRGSAVPANAGLLGRSLETDSAWLHVRPVQLVTYDKSVDSCGLEKVHSLLLRSLRHEGMPLGAIQLVNRTGDGREFTQDDGKVADHIGDRLATTLHELKLRMPR